MMYVYMSYLATASLYTNPASARFTISKHRSAPSILRDNRKKEQTSVKASPPSKIISYDINSAYIIIHFIALSLQ